MILRELRDLARREGLYDDPDFEQKPVHWFIRLTAGGEFVGFEGTRTTSGSPGERPQAKRFSIPRQHKRTSAVSPQFLVDNSKYVLGIVPEGKGLDPARVAACRDAFRESVEETLRETGDPALRAVAQFLQDVAAGKARPPLPGEFEPGDLVSFVVGSGFEPAFTRPAAREYWGKRRSAGPAAPGPRAGLPCLVCGTVGPVETVHPAVKGVPGGQPSGTALVSFNKDAFRSFGLKQNENAPTCRPCAEAYVAGLNRLLDRRAVPRRRFDLGPATAAVFWTTAGSEVDDWIRALLEADPEAVAALYGSPWKGKPAPVHDPAAFRALTISGSQARAVLRDWYEDTLDAISANLHRHFQDIRIVRESWNRDRPVGLRDMLRSLAAGGDEERLPPRLPAEFFAAAMRGYPYPRALLDAAVSRIRADGKIPSERAALLKAVLRRISASHAPGSPGEVNETLNPTTKNPAYRCGRLLAVLEHLQEEAVGPKATLIDRFYGAACSAPASVFGRLLKTAQHHASKIDYGPLFQQRISEILEGMEGFPFSLSLEEQGLFAIGYYHQRAERFRRKDSAESGSPHAA